MRIPRYRVWHKQLKEMFTVVHLHFGIDGLTKIETSPTLSDTWKLEDLELMQWTGLTDKNGVEVCQGDIVKANRPWDNWGDTLQVVKYEHGTWNYSYDLHEYAANPEKDWEIVGNIYENPELLEVQS